jgi:hypothetical protein
MKVLISNKIAKDCQENIYGNLSKSAYLTSADFNLTSNRSTTTTTTTTTTTNCTTTYLFLRLSLRCAMLTSFCIRSSSVILYRRYASSESKLVSYLYSA